MRLLYSTSLMVFVIPCLNIVLPQNIKWDRILSKIGFLCYLKGHTFKGHDTIFPSKLYCLHFPDASF